LNKTLGLERATLKRRWIESAGLAIKGKEEAGLGNEVATSVGNKKPDGTSHLNNTNFKKKKKEWCKTTEGRGV